MRSVTELKSEVLSNSILTQNFSQETIVSVFSVFIGSINTENTENNGFL